MENTRTEGLGVNDVPQKEKSVLKKKVCLFQVIKQFL